MVLWVRILFCKPALNCERLSSPVTSSTPGLYDMTLCGTTLRRILAVLIRPCTTASKIMSDLLELQFGSRLPVASQGRQSSRSSNLLYMKYFSFSTLPCHRGTGHYRTSFDHAEVRTRKTVLLVACVLMFALLLCKVTKCSLLYPPPTLPFRASL